MNVVPQKPVERIQFYEQHITPWTTNAVAIGTTTTAVTALETKTEAARAAYNAHLAAQDAAKNATQAYMQAVGIMHLAGTAIIDNIRSAAKTSGPGVYTLAVIPEPVIPGPVGAPGTPESLKAELKPNGSVEMTFKCENPAGCTGVIYQVYRRIESTGEYQYLGGAGQRKFVDTSVPSGVPSVTYQIQATRSTSVGDAAFFTVNLGVASGSATTAFLGTSSVKGIPAKIAA